MLSNVYTQRKRLSGVQETVFLWFVYMPEGVFSRARSLILIGIRAAASYKTL